IEIDQPKQLRDMLWPSARIVSKAGVAGELVIPALYPGTSSHSDDLVRVGRKTDWQKLNEELCRGLGLKLFLGGESDHSVFEISKVELDLLSSAAQPSG